MRTEEVRVGARGFCVDAVVLFRILGVQKMPDCYSRDDLGNMGQPLGAGTLDIKQVSDLGNCMDEYERKIAALKEIGELDKEECSGNIGGWISIDDVERKLGITDE